MANDIPHLRSLLAAASPGEWIARDRHIAFADGGGQGQVGACITRQNAALIVALRNAAPSLLAELETLRRVAKAARDVAGRVIESGMEGELDETSFDALVSALDEWRELEKRA